MEENNFESDVQTVGEILRNARIKQGKTVSEIAKELCVRKSYIDAMEKMEVEQLPQMPYALGFVRSYANFLGLNSDRIVSSYRKTVTGDDEETEEKEAHFEQSVPKLSHVLLGLLGLIALFVIWSFWPQLKQTDISETETVVSDVVPEPEIIDETQLAVEGSAPEDDILPQEKYEEPVDTDVNKENTESGNEIANPETDATAEGRIKFELTGPSWVELKQGDNVLLSGIYHKGFEYTVPSGSNMVISIGRYYNAKFYIDGKEIKVVSSLKHINVELDEFLKQD